MTNIKYGVLIIAFFAILMLFFLVLPLIPYETDEERFEITIMEKWGDLNNKNEIILFCEYNGYDEYTIKRYSNRMEYPLILHEGEKIHYVSNPDDAYIVCIKSNGDEKKYDYRDYKEWMLKNV